MMEPEHREVPAQHASTLCLQSPGDETAIAEPAHQPARFFFCRRVDPTPIHILDCPDDGGERVEVQAVREGFRPADARFPPTDAGEIVPGAKVQRSQFAFGRGAEVTHRTHFGGSAPG